MLSLAKFIKKEIELRENLVGDGFIEPPAMKAKKFGMKLMEQYNEEMQSRVTVLGEIVSANGFSTPDTYVQFETLLPEQGWVYEDVNEYEIFGQVRDTTVEYNKRKTVTQISSGRVIATTDMEDEDTTKFQSHFSFPFDLQFLAKDPHFEESRPYLLMQVNSTDSWNRHKTEGYGFIRLPMTAGYHQIEVPTWRPRASLDTEIHSFFLGGSVRIQRMEELVRAQYIDSNGRSDVVNRFGLETEDAGTIIVNLNICFQNIEKKRTVKKAATIQKEKERLETRKLVMKYSLEVQKQQKTQATKKLAARHSDTESQQMDSYAKNNYDNDEVAHGKDYNHAQKGFGARYQ